MKTILFSFILILAVVPTLQAQQLARFTQARELDFVFNPAAVEISEELIYGQLLDIKAAYRQNWTEFENAPSTALAAIRYTNPYIHCSFTGSVVSDRFGPTDYLQASLGYSYQLLLNRYEDQVLSLGIGVNFNQFKVDGTKLDPFEPNDDLLVNGLQSAGYLNAGAGVFYNGKIIDGQRPAYLFAGVSAQQLIPDDVNLESQSSLPSSFRREFHLFSQLGARFYINTYGDYVEPYVWSNFSFKAPFHGQFGTRITFLEQKLITGFSITTDWEMFLQFGGRVIDKVYVHYAGGLFLADIFNQNPGVSHEVMVAYRWQK